MDDPGALEDVDLDQCSAEELIFRIHLANAEREQAELVAQVEAENFQSKQDALEHELLDTTGMNPTEFEEFVGHLPETAMMNDAIKPLKGTVGKQPKYDTSEPEPEPVEYLEAISAEVKDAALKLRDAKHKEEMLVEEVVELKKVRNRLFGDNEATVSAGLQPVPSLMADPINDVSIEEVLLLNGSKMHGVENMLMLNPMCEATAAESLQARFSNQQMYSCIDAESLVVVNPNAWLASSSRAMAAFYKGKGFLAPHVNSQAQALLGGIARDGRNRSLYYRGETGSGKSTALAQLLEYFEVEMSGSEMVSQIKHAQKVLSAFTNCMGNGCDNSSRASTALELQLDSQQQLIGCFFSVAGLEVSRVTECYPGERSFHVLHYIAHGTSPPEQEALHFQPDEDFNWLTQNGVLRVPGVDDETAYHELKQSLLSLDFSAKERAYLLRMVSLILNLGNLKFSKSKPTNSVTIGPASTLEACATMLRSDVPALAEALTDGFTDAPSAGRARDVFGRLLYSRLTAWVTRRLNQTLGCVEGVVNVLVAVDAAGFENVSTEIGNGFDQLMRNYSSERLAALSDSLVFARTEADFAREEIKSTSKYPKHAAKVTELFERESGIIELVGSTEMAPMELVAAIAKLSNSMVYTNKGNPNLFTIRHSCGDVTYNALSFRRLACCVASEPVVAMLKKSLCSFIKGELFSTEIPISEESSTMPIFAKEWQPPDSVLGSLKFQLDAIHRMVQPTEPRFTFCLRPNELSRPNDFNLMVVVREMRSCGLIKYLEFLTNAPVWRIPFQEFEAQFHALTPESHAREEHDQKENCIAILSAHLSDEAPVQLGKTRVYLARKEYQQLCTALYQVQVTHVTSIQAVARAALARGAPDQPKIKLYNPSSKTWEEDEEASQYTCEFDKIKKASTALVPFMKGWYVRSIERVRVEAEAELAKNAHSQPAQAQADLEAAAKSEWETSQKQQGVLLAENAVAQAQSLLDKFEKEDKVGPLIMGTAFSDLADPDTNLVTREAWNSHFGKDSFDKYDEDRSGVMDKQEWDEAFKSFASDFLSQRIEMFYEGALKTVQKEIEDKTEEEQNMHYNAYLMAAEDNYLKLLEEAEMRKVELSPEEERKLMAEEDRRTFQYTAISKAEEALKRLATLEDLNQAADTAAASSQPPGFGCVVDPGALEALVDGMVAQTKSEIESGVKMSPEKKQQQQRQMDNIHWQRVEERIMERENRKMIEMGLNLDSREARGNVAEEIEAEARASELVLQTQMNELLDMFGAPTRYQEENAHYDDPLVSVSGDQTSPIGRRPPYKGKYGFKYKHNKLETMSIHEGA